MLTYGQFFIREVTVTVPMFEQNAARNCGQQLLEVGIVTLPTTEQPTAIRAAQLLVRLLTGWSPERRKAMQVWEKGETEADLGLIRKGHVGEDKKWYFHYAPRLLGLLRAQGVELTPEELELFPLLQTVYDDGFQVALQAARGLDTVLGLENEQSFVAGLQVPDARWLNMLRIVVYDPPNSELMYVAQPHYDKSSVTVHYAESEHGLEVAVDSQDPEVLRAMMGLPHMELAPTAEQRCRVFMGGRASARTGGRAYAKWHRARKSSTADCRWAIIFFAKTLDNTPPGFDTHDYWTVRKNWPQP